MNQVLHTRDAISKVTAGNFSSSTPTRKNISYNEREDYIVDIEKKLMKKWRMGFSQLHKNLVVKAGHQEFGPHYIF